MEHSHYGAKNKPHYFVMHAVWCIFAEDKMRFGNIK